MTTYAYQITLLLNVLWFGAGFWYFALKRNTAAKLLVPRSARSSPLFLTLRTALPFLGGMNFALSLLSAMVLLWQDLFLHSGERAILLIGFAVAHTSQFGVNVPVARAGGRQGESYWDVLSGPMLFIFVVDAALALLNFGCALFLAMNR